MPNVMLSGIALGGVRFIVQVLRKSEKYNGTPNPVSPEQLAFFGLSGLIRFSGVALTPWLRLWIGEPMLIGASIYS